MNSQEKKTTGVIIHVLRRTENKCFFLFLLRSGGRFEGRWWPVAGTCEPNERTIDSVLRELKEETGLSPIEVYKLGKDITHEDRVSKLEGFVIFVSANSVVELNYEHSDYKWLTTKETLEIVPVFNQENILYIESNFINRLPSEELRVWASTEL